jgi:DNA-binding CsgD family transcriptional regulator
MTETDSGGEDPHSLTFMQRKVVRLCALGCSVTDVAKVLDISPATAANHKANAMGRLQINGTARLTRWAIRSGVSPIGDALTPLERDKLQGEQGPTS